MKTLNEIFTAEAITFYYEKVNWLIELNKAWQAFMPTWRDSSQVANFENGKLTIQATNAAMATRLKFSLPDILQKISGSIEFSGVHQIQVQVRPSQPKPPKKFDTLPCSETVKNALQETKEIIEKALEKRVIRQTPNPNLER